MCPEHEPLTMPTPSLTRLGAAEPLTVSLRLDAELTQSKVDEFISFLKEFVEVRECFFDRFVHGTDSLNKVFRLNRKLDPACRAGDLVVFVDFTDDFLNFMAACRAGDVQRGIFDA